MATIQVPAIRFKQGKHTLYSFVLDGKKIDEVASVAHMERLDDEVRGYQRPEVAAHIKEIQKYLDGAEDPMIPNSIILCFEDPPSFKAVERGSQLGTLSVNKAAWIVDGQQRTRAILASQLPEFPVSVVAFVAEDEETQREHFVRVNSSKPLPKNILSELLPGIEAELTSALEKKRVPATIAARLNNDADSPLHRMIRTATNSSGVISDGTIMRMVEASLTNGCLFFLREDGDIEGMVAVLKHFWEAVSQVFPADWDMPAKQSRLLHSAGVISLGRLMDQMADDTSATKLTTAYFKKLLKIVEPVCHWHEGTWNFGQAEGTRNWDGVENTARGIELLSGLLIRTYRASIKTKNDSTNETAA